MTFFIPRSVGGDEWYALWREAPSAPPLGELLSEREAEGVQLDEWGCYEPTHDTPSATR